MTKTNTLTGRIKRSLTARGRGVFVFADDFHFDTRDKTRVALKRLVDYGYLMRIDDGIFYYPHLEENGEFIYPSALEIARAYAKHKGAALRDNNEYILNRLHLSEQVPMKTVYLTDGLKKTINYGRLQINLVPDTFDNAFKLTGNKSRLAIYALLGLGEKNVTPEKIETLRPQILGEDPEVLRQNYEFAPEWIQKVLYDNYLV